MIFHAFLRTSGCKTRSRLSGPGPQWAVTPWNYYYYYYYYYYLWRLLKANIRKSWGSKSIPNVDRTHTVSKQSNCLLDYIRDGSDYVRRRKCTSLKWIEMTQYISVYFYLIRLCRRNMVSGKLFCYHLRLLVVSKNLCLYRFY